MPYKNGTLMPYTAKDTVSKSDLASNTTLKRYRPTTGESSLTSMLSKHMRQAGTPMSTLQYQATNRVKKYMESVRRPRQGGN